MVKSEHDRQHTLDDEEHLIGGIEITDDGFPGVITPPGTMLLDVLESVRRQPGQDGDAGKRTGLCGL